ncbi:MAG TPA: EipA family protein [Allosphingosinicella sp.]
MHKLFLNLLAVGGLVLSGPAFAQITTIDPNDAGEYEPAVDGPVQAPQSQNDPAPSTDHTSAVSGEYVPVDSGPQEAAATPSATVAAPQQDAAARASAAVSSAVPRSNVFQAAEGVFGRGAEGLAGLIENILKKQGEPTAYITGREAGGAVVVGLRYGSGTLHHQVQGDSPIYWTGPSVGLDFGADANKVFVLVYNVNDKAEMLQRFGAAEGNAYVVGGFTASYLRNGDKVLIPIRMGVGVRLGVNAGYMKFSEKGKWFPF